MSCLFNSYDPYFKQPFGALRAGQTVRLTLCIPEELGYVDPHLVLQKEGKYDVPVHYRMKFDGQTPLQNHFSVEIPLNDPGLYFYYFDLYTDFRRIVRGPDNCGVVSWNGTMYINMIRNIREPELESRFYRVLHALGLPVKVESNQRWA